MHIFRTGISNSSTWHAVVTGEGRGHNALQSD